MEFPSLENLKKAINDLKPNENNNDRKTLDNLLKLIASKTSSPEHNKLLIALINFALPYLPYFHSTYKNSLNKILKEQVKVNSFLELPRDEQFICNSQLEKFIKFNVSEAELEFLKDSSFPQNKTDLLAQIILIKNSVENLEKDKYALTLKPPKLEELTINFKNLPDNFNKKSREQEVDITRCIHFIFETSLLSNPESEYDIKFAWLLFTAHVAENSWFPFDDWYRDAIKALHIEHTQQLSATKKFNLFTKLAEFIDNNMPKHKNLSIAIHKEAKELLPFIECELDPHPEIAKIRDKVVTVTNYSLKFGVVAVAAQTAEALFAGRIAWSAGGLAIKVLKATAPERLAFLSYVAAKVLPDVTAGAIGFPLTKIGNYVANSTGDAVYIILAAGANVRNKIFTEIKELHPEDNLDWIYEIKENTAADVKNEFQTKINPTADGTQDNLNSTTIIDNYQLAPPVMRMS